MIQPRRVNTTCQSGQLSRPSASLSATYRSPDAALLPLVLPLPAPLAFTAPWGRRERARSSTRAAGARGGRRTADGGGRRAAADLAQRRRRRLWRRRRRLWRRRRRRRRRQRTDENGREWSGPASRSHAEHAGHRRCSERHHHHIQLLSTA